MQKKRSKKMIGLITVLSVTSVTGVATITAVGSEQTVSEMFSSFITPNSSPITSEQVEVESGSSIIAKESEPISDSMMSVINSLPTTRASTEKVPNWSYPSNPYAENGIIYWYTTGKKATSAIRYRTVGWTVTLEKVPDGNISKSGLPYGKILMKSVASVDGPGEGITTTYFECSEEDVKRGLNQIKNADGTSVPLKNGMTMYLHAITEVYKVTNPPSMTQGIELG